MDGGQLLAPFFDPDVRRMRGGGRRYLCGAPRRRSSIWQQASWVEV
jgi:hypothetical protein